jgi:Sec-independent protein secretion pathway component TatC
MRNQVSLDGLRRNRGLVLALAFVVSALTQLHAPPDAITLVIMAVSIYLLFEAGLLFARLFLKK